MLDIDMRTTRAATARDGILPITVIILTRDEELHIERCLANVLQFAERAIVIDSFSTDRTVEIARRIGAEVVQRAFTHQAEQLQWAIDTLDIASPWVMRLDADEYLEAPLIEELRRTLPALPGEVAGVRLKRKVIFQERWIRFGGYYPTILLRLWRQGAAEVQQLWMDEHAVLKHGRAITAAHDFRDHNLRDITWWTEKHNRYATRKMVDFISLEHDLGAGPPSAFASSDSARTVKRFLQYGVFRRTPLYLRAVLLFLYRYVLRLGFLDGRPGFVWNALQGFWYAMLIDAKIAEARAFIAVHGIEAFKTHLAERHGILL